MSRTTPGRAGGGGTSAPDANRRRALVFGGGGVLGFAWTVGALRALETEWGIEANAVGLTVGTSAGSMLAALLGCGIGADVIRRHHQGVPAPADPGIVWDYSTDSGGARPPWPGFLPGSPRLVLDAVRHPASIAPAVVLSGLLPRGRGTLDPIRAVISAAATAAGSARSAGASGRSAGGDPDGRVDERWDVAVDIDGADVTDVDAFWPDRPRTLIVATDYDSGDRVVFGRDAGDRHALPDAGDRRARSDPGASPVRLADAVAASCAIPAWYSPVRIGDGLYIDGGTVSNASADLVLPAVRDGSIGEVFVLAPMASVEPDRPRSPIARLERVVRRAVTRGIQHDAERLRAAGARVVVLTPGPYDLDVMGANLMNPRRRTEVLQTSLLTSVAALRELRLNEDIATDTRRVANARDPRDTANPRATADLQYSADRRDGPPAGRTRAGYGQPRVGAGGARAGRSER